MFTKYNSEIIITLAAEYRKSIQEKWSSQEIGLITELVNLTNATKIIEYGSWLGLFATCLLKSLPNITSYRAIEGVELYGILSKMFVSNKKFDVFPALLFNNNTKNFISDFVIDLDHTIGSSSLYTTRYPRKLGNPLKIKTANAYDASTFLDIHPEFLDSDAYIKIDIDGVDQTLVCSYIDKILETNIKPKGIQFEFYGRGWESIINQYPYLRNKLQDCGYSVPFILDLAKDAESTIAVTEKYWFVSEWRTHDEHPKVYKNF